MNYKRDLNKKNALSLSLTHKSAKGNRESITRDIGGTVIFDPITGNPVPDPNAQPDVMTSGGVKFKSLSLSGLYTYTYKRRFFFSGLLVLEQFEVDAEENNISFNEDGLRLKFGVNAALKF